MFSLLFLFSVRVFTLTFCFGLAFCLVRDARSFFCRGGGGGGGGMAGAFCAFSVVYLFLVFTV